MEKLLLDMSFHDGTMNREKLKEFIKNTEKPIRYTYGFKYRNPTTKNIPISKEEALRIASNESLLDARELSDCLDLNAYSGNDMW